MQEVVNDIYRILQEGHEISDEWADELGKDIATMLKRRLAPQERGARSHLSLSALGRGDRYLWYVVNDAPREPLSPPVQLKFLFGDIIELFLIALVRLTGHEVADCQKEVELDGIKGHIDCLIDGQLIDVKSASSFSFKKFQNGILHMGDRFGYYDQLAAYAQAMGIKPAGWLVMDKQLGHLCFAEARPEYIKDMEQRVKHIKAVLKFPDEPERCHNPVPEGSSGNMKLPVECSYCPFKWHCYRDANGGQGIRTFLYSKGPVYLTHVEKLPKVPECYFEERETA